jgi:Spy/CpxP family protein refolding chaperone
MKKFFLFSLVLAVTLAGAAALAQRRINQGQIPPNPRGRQQRPFPGPRKNLPPPGQKEKIQRQLMEAIGLTSDQRFRMADIRRNNEDGVISAGRRFRQARSALDRAIMSEEYDEQIINRRIDELAAAQAELVKQHSRVRAQMRSVLTTEQVQRLRELEREWIERKRQQKDREMKDLDQKDKELSGELLFDSAPEVEEDFIAWLLFG